MKYTAYAINEKHQTIRIECADEQHARRTAQTAKRRLERRYPWLTATPVVEIMEAAAAPINWDNELL